MLLSVVVTIPTLPSFLHLSIPTIPLSHSLVRDTSPDSYSSNSSICYTDAPRQAPHLCYSRSEYHHPLTYTSPVYSKSASSEIANCNRTPQFQVQFPQTFRCNTNNCGVPDQANVRSSLSTSDSPGAHPNSSKIGATHPPSPRCRKPPVYKTVQPPPVHNTVPSTASSSASPSG